MAKSGLVAEVESRTQGSRPRPRTQKKSEAKAKAKDSLSEDRHSRGQSQGPRTQAQVLSKKKRSSQKFFRRSPKKKKKRSPQKNVFQKIFQALHIISTIQKIVLSSSRGQANFRGLDLRGQGLQNVSSRPRTSSRTPPLTSGGSRKFWWGGILSTKSQKFGCLHRN